MTSNHYAPKGEKDLRMIDLRDQKYLNEVIEWCVDKYGVDSHIYLAGFSLGGNHILRYAGQAAKEKLEGCKSSHVKGIIAVSMPFDVRMTGERLKKTYMGLFDKIICWS